MRPAAVFASLLLIVPSLRANDMCSSEYQRGQREMGAYAEMVGIVEGALYGYSMILKPGQFCLPGGTPKEKVQAISRALGSEQFRRSPVLMDDVPTEQEALEFFQAFFPCIK